MNNNFSVILNGTKIECVRQGIVINESLSEDLMTATVIYNTKNSKLAISYETPCSIIDNVSHTTYMFVVAKDTETVICQNPIIYQHTLLLVNPKKIYTRFPVSTFTLTHTANQEKSIYEVLNILRRNYPLETLDNFDSTRLFNIPDSWQDDEKFQVKVPEMVIKNTSLAELLDRIFKNADLLCDISDVISKNKIPTLSYVDPNKRVGILSERSFKENQETDAFNNARTMQTELQNAVIDDDENEQMISYYPGKNLYARTKLTDSSSARLDDKLMFVVDKPIVKLLKLNLLSTMVVRLLKNGEEIIRFRMDFPVDVSDWVYVKDQYNILYKRSKKDKINKIPSNEYQNDVMYYEYKGKIIYDGNKESSFKNSIFEAAFNSITNFDDEKNEFVITYENEKWYYIGFDKNKDKENQFSLPEPPSLETNEIGEVLYNVEYITESNAIVNQKRIEETSNVESYITIGQQDQIPDIKKIGRNMMGIINRIGLDKITICNRVQKSSLVPKLGEYTSNNYVVVEKEVSHYNDYSEYMLVLQKNFNLISQNVSIDEEQRTYDVPRGGMYNEVHYDEYMIFSVYEGKDNTSFMKNINWLRFLGPDKYSDSEIEEDEDKLGDDYKYNHELSNFKLGTVMFFTYSDKNKENIRNAVYVPVQTFALGNSICFNYKFDDNIIAGNQISGKTEKAVKYTNDDGYINYFSFNIIKNDQITCGADKKYDFIPGATNSISKYDSIKKSATTYPEISTEAINRISQFPEDNVIETPIFNYYKDPQSIFGMTYQIHCVPAKNSVNNITIGEAFCYNNPLIIDHDKLKELYIYTNFPKTSPLNNKRCLGQRSEDDHLVVSSFEDYWDASDNEREKPYMILETYQRESNFEVGDKDGNLYLRVQGADQVYISFRNKRDF